MQMLEHDPTLAKSVIQPIYKFVVLANNMLKNGTGLEPWTQSRWEEFAIALQW